MTNNPFGWPENAAERFIREERQRAELYRSMLGGGGVAEAIKQASAQHKIPWDLNLDGPLQTVRNALEYDRANREALKLRASSAWAQSVAETARDISWRNADLIEQQRLLSSSVLDTMRAFDLNRGAIQTAIAAAKAERDVRQMIAGSLSDLANYGAIAERMKRLDMMTLRASDEVTQSATALAADMVLETQRIAEAIAAAPTAEDGAVLIGELFEKILSFLASLGPKTINEISSMGLIQWSGWLFGFVGFVVAIVTIVGMQPGQSPQQQAAITELSQKYEGLKEQMHRFGEAEARANEAYLKNLPRAELSRDAAFRRKPERAGEVVLKAPQGMSVAIEKSGGRWRLVVFRDPLSEQLSHAWVYASAIRPLADASDEPAP